MIFKIYYYFLNCKIITLFGFNNLIQIYLICFIIMILFHVSLNFELHVFSIIIPFKYSIRNTVKKYGVITSTFIKTK